MMKTIASLFLVLIATSCATRFANVRRFELGLNNPVALVVIDEHPTSSTLGYVDDQNQLHVIRAQLDGLGELRKLYLSPSRKKVIIESYGEGHQFLSVFVIGDLIAKHKKSDDFIHSFRTLDPYPSGFGDIHWVTDDCIHFSASSDMSQFDREMRRGKDRGDAVSRKWRWHLEKDVFEQVRSQPHLRAYATRGLGNPMTVEIPNTRSPDGQYALFAISTEGTAGVTGIATSNRKTCLAITSVFEYGLNYDDRKPTSYLTVLWSSDSTYVAIHDSARKHSRLEVFAFGDSGARKVEFPDLFMVMSAQDIMPPNPLSSGQEPLEWIDAKHLVVEVRAKTQSGKKVSKQMTLDLEKGMANQ
jgi:hypothetical protein